MIYFMRHLETGLIKIGSTDRYNERYAALLTLYGTLELMGLMDGNKTQERQLHKQYQPCNIRGQLKGQEWFSPTDELLAYITEHTHTNVPEETPRYAYLPPAVCTQEFKDELQNVASEMDRSMSWVMIHSLELFMKDYRAGKDSAADDGWKNR